MPPRQNKCRTSGCSCQVYSRGICQQCYRVLRMAINDESISEEDAIKHGLIEPAQKNGRGRQLTPMTLALAAIGAIKIIPRRKK